MSSTTRAEQILLAILDASPVAVSDIQAALDELRGGSRSPAQESNLPLPDRQALLTPAQFPGPQAVYQLARAVVDSIRLDTDYDIEEMWKAITALKAAVCPAGDVRR